MLFPALGLVIFMLSGSSTTSDPGSCSTDENERNEIRQSLSASPHSVYYPGDVEIVGICTVADRVAAFTSLVWGNLRETKRIALFEKGRGYIGNYPVPEFPVGVSDGVLIFSFPEDAGNSIDLSGREVPSRIFLDSTIFHFERVDQQ